MPSTRTSTIPAPIAVVLEHHGDLQTAYVRRRAAHDKTEAFVGAVSEVLSQEQVSNLSQLISGSYDPTYDADRGAAFGQLLLDDLEQGFQDVQRTRSRARRWQHLDTAAVVDAIAHDMELASLHAQALDEHNDAIARALVGSAVRVVVEKASATRHAPDTRRALEDAAATFGRYATGTALDPQLDLLRDDADTPVASDATRIAWCAALASEVSAAR